MGRRRFAAKRKGHVAPWHKRGGKRRPNGPPAKHRQAASPWIWAGDHKIKENDIIGFIHRNNGRATLDEIAAALAPGNKQVKVDLELLLKSLCHQNTLTCKAESYSIRRTNDLFTGELSVLPRGFGFVAVEGGGKKTPLPESDIFIPASALASAMHGDRVLVQSTGKSRGRIEGRVISVLSRASSTLVGIYRAGKPTGMVTPEDKRFTFDVLIDKTVSRGARNGEAVVVEITEFKSDQRNHIGRVVEVLGDPQSLTVQTEIVIRKFNLPHTFSAKALRESAKLSDTMELTKDRLDLREIVHVTIDGETARDFDDAVAIDKTAEGYRLYVSIADVSHYVQPGSAIDQEAYERGTSVYFSNRVVPMLPERLSNNLCSLVPDEDRLAFTAIMEFDKNGRRIDKKFSKSIIRSRHRLTYTIVKEILVDHAPKVRKKYSSILSSLENMAELAKKLEKLRMQRGSIGFEIPEAQIIINEADNEDIQDIRRSERNQAHKLIEEFMLAANEAVAATFSAEKDGRFDFLYRIHETPDPNKVEEFAKFAKTLGLNVGEGSGTPQWFGKVLAITIGTPYEYIVSNLLLRTMKQAKYDPENVGHFGLAAADYTHFTSPIRRYPDLMVHRALQMLITGVKQKNAKTQYASAEEAGAFLSKRERVAVEAEREMVQRLMARYMAGKIGETFEGIVSGVTAFGMFIELLGSFVSGAVPIIDMKDDYYQLDEKNHRLTGKLSGRIFQIGDQINVRVAGVELDRNRINFMVAEDESNG